MWLWGGSAVNELQPVPVFSTLSQSGHTLPHALVSRNTNIHGSGSANAADKTSREREGERERRRLCGCDLTLDSKQGKPL